MGWVSGCLGNDCTLFGLELCGTGKGASSMTLDKEIEPWGTMANIPFIDIQSCKYTDTDRKNDTKYVHSLWTSTHLLSILGKDAKPAPNKSRHQESWCHDCCSQSVRKRVYGRKC